MSAAAVALAAALAGPASAGAAPRAVLDSGPPARTPDTAGAFAFHPSEQQPPLFGLVAPTSFQCRLDGGAWSFCESPRSYTGLTGGPHSFDVRAAGDFDDHTPASLSWVVEIFTETLPPCGGSACADPVPVRPTPARSAPKPRARRRRDAAGCAYAANYPGEVAMSRLETAVLCLFNHERRLLSLPQLRTNRALRAAAKLHASDMWLHKFFRHLSRNGSTPLQRIIRAGYFGPGQYGTVGEVLAWGDGRYATPRATVSGFMRSRAHREIILGPAFREVGIGLAPGAPRRDRSRALTVAAELGRRG